MKCKICQSESKEIFKHKVLKKFDVQYYFCDNCGFVFTEEPYWLDEAYNSPINEADTGLLWRNNLLSKHISILFYLLFDKTGKFLDYAGGYGIFVRLMRDIGFDFYWDDLYSQNLLSRGFECDYNDGRQIEAITSFETFEHFANPLEEIEKMLKLSKNIIFTTELMPKTCPMPDEWWYYLFDYGQHINFYSNKTLNYIAKKYDLNFYTIGWLNIITEKTIKTRYRRLINNINVYKLSTPVLKLLFYVIKNNMVSKMSSDSENIRNGMK